MGSLDSFSEFVTAYNLDDSLQTLEITNKHTNIIQGLLVEAVQSAKKLYKIKIQGDLQDEVEEKLEQYQKKLNNWVRDSERQLELHFGEVERGIVTKYKEQRKRDIKNVQELMNRYYEEFFQLENEPYLRLLAVFYNA